MLKLEVCKRYVIILIIKLIAMKRLTYEIRKADYIISAFLTVNKLKKVKFGIDKT